MPEHVLVEYLTQINNIINQNFQTTNRIKFLCFEVSKNYIIFGANSGGIYIFKRKPCQFLKLIPSKEGSASILAISREEKNLAIASTKGFVIILEDCFADNNLSYQVYSHHVPNLITALQWHGNDLFCGDKTGKISVINMMNFLSKAIFQAPTSVLMSLDSSIIQIDTFSNFLLISTQTRTYLCDTQKEEYRQIGVKLRDGQFGACFYNKPQIDCDTNNSFSSDNECQSSQYDNIKIFCARPGARLWQANFKASVICTHQFKQCLEIKSSDLIVFDDNIDKLIIENSADTIIGFNFGKLYCLDKFIVTFKDDGFYIFDPMNSFLKFWIKINDIRDVKIINNNLFVWSKLGMRVFSLRTVEDIIIKSLLRKQYNLCGELCVKFSSNINNLLEKSKRIHLITILKSKIKGDLLENVLPILQQIDEFSRNKYLQNTDKKGVVIVENLYDPESVKDVKESTINIIKQQFELNKFHKNVETTNFKNLLDTLNFEELVQLFEGSQIGEENSKPWCQEIFLKQFQKTGVSIEGLSDNCLEYLFAAFIDVEGNCLNCPCNFPLPDAHKHKSKFYEIGCKLMEKFGETIIKSVPYFYRYHLNNFNVKDLALVVQYSDLEILKNNLNKFDYDIWDETLRFYIKLKKSICLNCNKKIDIKSVLKWKDLGLLMIQSIGANNTIKLFKSYSNFISNGALNEEFYHYCILNSVTDLRIDGNLFEDQDSANELGKLTAKYLNKKYLSETQGRKWSNLNCDFCNLRLDIPILEEVEQLDCGHHYHSLCYIYNKRKCTSCLDDS